MAYKFDNTNSNKITTGATLTPGSSRSIAVRFKANTLAASPLSVLYTYGDTDVGPILYFNGNASGTQVQLSYADAVFGQVLVAWNSSFNTGEVHTLVGTVNTSTFDSIIYADTDASAKNVANAGGFNGFAIGGGSPLQYIGNYLNSALGFLGVIYELAVWDGTAIAGSQAAMFGAGYDAQFLTPKPTYHWRLIGTAQELRAGAASTVSGATVVAHDAPIRYPAPPQIRRLTVPASATPAPITRFEGSRGAWRGSWRGVHRGMA